MIYLIAGYGPAGVQAIQRVREIDAAGRILLVAAEDSLPYNRIMVPELMVHEVEENALYIRREDFLREKGVEMHRGRIVELRTEEQTVVLDSGAFLPYDRLLLATGSRSVVPRWIDPSLQGVFSLWDKADALEIQTYLEKGQRAVIIGAGLVGLQAARVLTAYGLDVTVVEKQERLMPTQLDRMASNMLVRAMAEQGVKLYLATEVKSLAAKDGKVKAVELEEKILEADLVIVAIGVAPNLDYVKGTPLFKEKGLIVDEYMQTSIPNIFAAGDVTQSSDPMTGRSVLKAIWPNAVQQGKVAGANMAGVREKTSGCPGMNSIQLFGVTIFSFGVTLNEGSDMTEYVFTFPESGAYRKVLLRDRKLVGGILAGKVEHAGILFHKLGQDIEEGFWGPFQMADEEVMESHKLGQPLNEGYWGRIQSELKGVSLID